MVVLAVMVLAKKEYITFCELRQHSVLAFRCKPAKDEWLLR